MKPSQNTAQEPNGTVTARFIAATPTRTHAPEVMDAARMCLVDWCGVALGAYHEPAAQAVRRVAEGWGAAGPAPMLRNGTTSAILSALVNGTMAHCLDFDDTHVGSLTHLSGPTWAAVLALSAEGGLSGEAALSGFITGFEQCSAKRHQYSHYFPDRPGRSRGRCGSHEKWGYRLPHQK